jgi:hypothetical protein
MIRLLRHLVGTLLLALMLVPFAFFFPALFLLAPNEPDARVLIFFAAPLSAGVVTLIYSQWSSVHAWNRMGRLGHWREDHGGIVRTVPRACGWLFGSIFFSFIAEFAFVFSFRSAPFGMLVLATYSPIFFCWCWRRTGHV